MVNRHLHHVLELSFMYLLHVHIIIIISYPCFNQLFIIYTFARVPGVWLTRFQVSISTQKGDCLREGHEGSRTVMNVSELVQVSMSCPANRQKRVAASI